MRSSINTCLRDFRKAGTQLERWRIRETVAYRKKWAGANVAVITLPGNGAYFSFRSPARNCSSRFPAEQVPPPARNVLRSAGTCTGRRDHGYRGKPCNNLHTPRESGCCSNRELPSRLDPNRRGAAQAWVGNPSSTVSRDQQNRFSYPIKSCQYCLKPVVLSRTVNAFPR